MASVDVGGGGGSKRPGAVPTHQSMVSASGWRYWSRSPRLPLDEAGASLTAAVGFLGCRVECPAGSE